MNLSKKKIEIYCIIFFLVLFALKLNFFKNFFLISSNQSEYLDRIVKNYDFCSSTGIGYVYFIKKKFNLNQAPEIINFQRNPDLYWIFNTTKAENVNKKIILFNLKNNISKINLDKYKVLHNFKNDCLFVKNG